MQKFKVTGVDPQTGQVVNWEVEAQTVIDAVRIAKERGLRYVSVVHEPSEYPPLRPQDPPSAANGGGKAPERTPERGLPPAAGREG